MRSGAKANGVKFGRKPSLTPHQQQEARKRIDAGETQRSVARSYNVESGDGFDVVGMSVTWLTISIITNWPSGTP